MRAFKISIILVVLVFAISFASQQAEADKVKLSPPPSSHSTTVHSGSSHHSTVHGSSSTGRVRIPGGHPFRSGTGWWGDHDSHFGFGFGYYYPYYTWAYYPFWSWGYYPGYYWPYYSPYYSPYYYGYYPNYYGNYGYGGYYGYGEVRLEVKPKEAKVYVDGGYVGTVDDFDGWWQRLELPAGPHRLVIREQGFAPYAQTIRIYPGQDFKIKYQMEAGQDVISDKDMRLNPDEYGRRDNYYRDRRYDNRDRYQPRGDYQQGDNDRDQYQPDNSGNDRGYQPGDNNRGDDRGYQQGDNDRGSYSQPGDRDSNRQTLVLQVEPRDATVYIDGNYYGTADVNESGELSILLAPGKHRVEVVRPGFESYSKEVTVSGDKNSRLDIRLEKK